MCEHGNTVNLWVTIPADLCHSGRQEEKIKPIDRCISDLVLALEDAGVVMRGSCCGHGKEDGVIVLNDGRSLWVRPTDSGQT